MPVDFDDEDISDVVEEVNRPTQQIMAQRQVVEAEPDFEEQMSEVEARLEMAQYYRLLLSEPLFDDPPTPEVAERVEDEIRGFVKSRMQVLVGVGEPKKAEPVKIFSDAEVQALRTLAQPEVQEALKALAAKVLKKPTILEAKPLPKQKAEQPAPVLKEPILKKVGFKRRPSMVAEVSDPQQPQQRRNQPPVRRGQKQQKRIETHVTDDGTEIVRDLTPQARPVGTIHPLPTPTSREQIEANAAQSAAYQARVALNTLEQNLRGKG